MVAIHAPIDIREPFRRWLGRFPDDPIHDRNNGVDRVALIIHDREDEMLRRVFANAVAVLGPTWNYRFRCIPGLDWDKNNRLFRSPAFWESFREDRVLVFQRDTVIFRPVPDGAMQWDMIGAPSGAVKTAHWTMNGGLSIRRPLAMLAVLTLESPTSEPEDRYFTRGLQYWDGRIPDMETAAQFAVESMGMITPSPVGVHGTDKYYLTDDETEQLVCDAEASAGGAEN